MLRGKRDRYTSLPAQSSSEVARIKLNSDTALIYQFDSGLEEVETHHYICDGDGKYFCKVTKQDNLAEAISRLFPKAGIGVAHFTQGDKFKAMRQLIFTETELNGHSIQKLVEDEIRSAARAKINGLANDEKLGLLIEKEVRDWSKSLFLGSDVKEKVRTEIEKQIRKNFTVSISQKEVDSGI